MTIDSTLELLTDEDEFEELFDLELLLLAPLLLPLLMPLNATEEELFSEEDFFELLL